MLCVICYKNIIYVSEVIGSIVSWLWIIPIPIHQIVVPKSLIQDVIRANHDPSYLALPGIKRTHNVIASNYWLPGMRRTIEYYVQKCDSCQRRKEDRQFTAALSSTEVPERPFQITSLMDWDLQLPFFLMGYRATPHTTTGYSPCYLLHGREMSLPGNDNLKAKVATNARDIFQ